MRVPNVNNLAQILKQRRIMIPLTLLELARTTNVSSSHLGRIERGERFPSAQFLRRLAKPLGFGETELLILGGYLSPEPSVVTEDASRERLDPEVAKILSQEPVEIQWAVITILSVMKNMARMLRRHFNTEDKLS